MADPLLSIVMPVLNAAGTIERSLDSIRHQGRQDVEVVVMDGGSRDGTLDLLRSRDDVVWHSGSDKGLSDAFNKGVLKARGSVIGWLNADDVYLPGALDAVAQAWTATGFTWLIGRCDIVDGRGAPIRSGVTRYKDALLDRYSHTLHLTHNFVPAPSTFFRRDAFLASGGMDVGLRYSMDYDLFLRLGRDTPPCIVDQRLAAFTMTEGTLSMEGFRDQFSEHRDVARRYRRDAPAAYAANVALSELIVLAYKGMRWNRRRKAAPAPG